VDKGQEHLHVPQSFPVNLRQVARRGLDGDAEDFGEVILLPVFYLGREDPAVDLHARQTTGPVPSSPP
jgi:hypothetical protein